MTRSIPTNLSASVRQRLLNRARATREDFQFVLTRFALERLLFRLGSSPHADSFVLKGAMLFALWSDLPHRSTRDLDLLGSGAPAFDRLEAISRELCLLTVPDDGLTFLPDTVQASRIREDQEYEGVRVTLVTMLERARVDLQVDVGFGDTVTPAALETSYPRCSTSLRQ